MTTAFLKCGECERPFTPKSSRSLFCTSRCREMAKRKKRKEELRGQCRVCRKIFVRSQLFREYCGKECQTEGVLAIKNRKSKVPATPKSCLFCKKEFKPRTATHKFCSDGCRVGHQAKEAREFTRKHGARAKVARKGCDYCGEMFVPKMERHIYCSSMCKDKGVKLKQKQWHNQKKREAKAEEEKRRMLREQIAEGDTGSWKTVFKNGWVELTQSPTNVEGSDYKDQIEAFLKRGGKIQKQGVGFASNPMTTEFGEASPLGGLDTRTV